MNSPKNNRNYGADIASRVLEKIDQDPLPAPRKELVQRGKAISALGSDVVYNQNLWVDPESCRPSPVNARDYDALTFDDCADLIETLKSEGRQRTPAIVRPTGDDSKPYEIVAGLRRHWSITWLRNNHYPDFKYLVDVQKLDDEAAFRLSDLENRARADITDLERGKSYRDALQIYYGGDREKMAERIGISSRNLLRYIWLAELDPVILHALGGHRAARVAHAQQIRSESGKTEGHASAILAEAQVIADEQQARVAAGEGAMPASEVVKRLIAAPNRRTRSAPPATHAPVQIASAAGKPMIEFVAGTARTAATIKLLPKAGASKEELQAEVMKLVDQFFEARR